MTDLIAAALILVLMAALMLTHKARMRVQGFQRELRGAIEEAERIHAEMVAQAGLEQEIERLRATLQALGRARLVGEELYFGDTPAGGCAIVDEAARQCGGVAALFVGGHCVAANLANAEDSRAVGAMLAPQRALERVLGDGLPYHGEVEILGEPYLTIYEPILAGGETAGMIVAGMKKMPPAAAEATRGGEGVSVTALKAVLRAQADTLHRSLAARREAEGRRVGGGSKEVRSAF